MPQPFVYLDRPAGRNRFTSMDRIRVETLREKDGTEREYTYRRTIIGQKWVCVSSRIISGD